jgi:hypothetical protein
MAYLQALIQYITYYLQPLVGLLAGMAIIAVVAYLNWYGTIKKDVVAWISSSVFGAKMGSEESADGLFMAVTGFGIMFGGLWIVLAMLYLSH